MTTAYTSLLGLALPVTGELSGTWGDTVNNSITSLLDSAIAGTTTLSTDVDVTLSNNDGTADTSRQAILLWTAGGTVTRTITAPALSKIYTVINASSSTQSIKVVGAGPTTGVTIIKGEAAMIAWNGSDFVKVSNTGGSFTTQDLTVTGNTILGDAITDTTTLNAQTRFLSLATLGYSNMTGPAATSLSTTAPAFLYSGATTYTVADVSGGTKAFAPIISLGQATIANATTATTFTNASTLYIAGAPSAGTNITITNPYALYVNAGDSYLGGNLGLGVKPSSQYSTVKAFQVGVLGATIITGQTVAGGTTSFGQNWYVDPTTANYFYAAASSQPATRYSQSAGQHQWFYASAGTAGNNITFNQAMTLDASGNLGIGATSPTQKLTVVGNILTANAAGTDSYINISTNGVQNTYLGFNNSGSTNGNGVLNNYSYVGNGNAYGLQILANGSVKATFDTSGNLGLGVTPSAWFASNKAFQIGSTGCLSNYTNGANIQTFLANNVYWNAAGTISYLTTNTATSYTQDNGTHKWYYAASGTAGNAITFTQAMTLDADGDLGIGQTSPAFKLDVQVAVGGAIAVRPSTTTGNAKQSALRLYGSDSVTTSRYAEVACFNDTAGSDTNALTFSTGYGATIYERARISSDGNLLVGNTAQSGTANRVAVFSANKFGLSIIDTTAQATGVGGALNFGGNYRSAGDAQAFARVAAVKQNSTDADYGYGMAFSVTPNGGTFTEAGRFDSSGNLLVGTTSQYAQTAHIVTNTDTASYGISVRDTGGTTALINFANSAGTQIGNILVLGGTGVSYNSVSDYRLKTVIGAVTGHGERLDALEPIEYTWIANGSRSRGFLAHKFQEVYATSVSGTKDAVDANGNPEYQSMDSSTSEVIADLVAEIQSLRKRLATAGI